MLIKLNIDCVEKFLKNKYEIEVEVIKDYPKDKDGNRITFRKVIEECGYPIISKEVAHRVYYAREYLKRKNVGEYAYKSLTEEIFTKDGKRSPYDKHKWGFLIQAPFKISSKCCDIMKKRPAHKYGKESGNKPILATMTEESDLRKMAWYRTGCNAFSGNDSKSQPMSFWTEQDVLKYILDYNLPLASPYGEIKQDNKGKYCTTGCNRTGCIFCGFGCHLEKEPNRFQQLKETYPKLYEYCMKPWEEGGLGLDEVLNYINVKH
jgi:hypothetical protein